MLNIKKNCSSFIWIFHFYLKERKLKSVTSLFVPYRIKNYFVHIRALKQALTDGLILKKVHRVTQLNQEAWLKQYIDINTKSRTETRNDFEKDFFKLMDHPVFRKTMENARKYRYLKLVTTYRRRNQLASEPNYDKTKYLMAVEMS